MSIAYGSPRRVLREGQTVEIFLPTLTTGKRGTLTIKERLEWVDVSNENAPGFSFRPGVAIGTWQVVGGTGQYARPTATAAEAAIPEWGVRGSRGRRASSRGRSALEAVLSRRSRARATSDV